MINLSANDQFSFLANEPQLLVRIEQDSSIIAIISMSTITTPPGKLLYFVYTLHQQGQITLQDKAALKNMIVTPGHHPIYDALKRYELEGTGLTLINELMDLLRKARASEALDVQNPGSRVRRSLSVTIPQRTLQNLPHIDGRI